MNYRTNKKPPCGPIYFNNFEKREDIIEQFGGTLYKSDELSSYMRDANRESIKERTKVEQSLDGAEILLAWYGPGSYEGAAFVRW